MQLDQVKAIITGGASGLGYAVAQHLVANGAQVALFDIDNDKGQTAIKALGDAVRFFRTDVTSEDGVVINVAAAHESMGGLNVVVNCAGILGSGRMLGKEGPMPLANFTGTVMVNLVGSFNVAKAGAALMQNNEPGDDGERGVIINTASVAAYEGQIGQAAYAASKGGVVSMTLPLARELARVGIRVNTIAPGIFWTPMVDGMPPQVQASLSASIPFPSRLGKPDEYADTVGFILGNRYINGETIRLDGAVRMQAK
ncbi:SDR family oxidoreductase [Rhodanobacter sp. MP1X3]|uniref:SDR family oxidoreductase n=1 Tax=Rhodanobacter sp. MP1X3 TaxID=2723086 RepID=UPI00160ADCB6|nr:SDR family oxidoreductase [Rhodanobacter sp. MP1X3]MBB6244104.1 NAD(P)-dependent dehydrogenase (short-subunit alcohol dehydrogenase family) [Rhodanobacter sp. MP1X3]